MAVKVFDVIGEEALWELYDLIDSVDGATIAGREMQKITGATSEYYSQWWYFHIKNEYEYKAAQFALKKGDILGSNVFANATRTASTTGSGLSTVAESAEVASAVDVGTYTAEGVEYSTLKGVGKAAAGTATESTSTLGSFVFGEVLPFVGAVATGAQVGLAIDDAIYAAHPDWWQYNVQNWDNVLLGHDTMLPILHDTKNGTTYITEEAFNTFMLSYYNLGAFSTAGEWNIPQNPESFEEAGNNYDTLTSFAYLGPGAVIYQTEENNGAWSYVHKYTFDCGVMLYKEAASVHDISAYAIGTTSGAKAFTVTTDKYSGGLPQHGGIKVSTITDDKYLNRRVRTINGKSVYMHSIIFTDDPNGNVPRTTTAPSPGATNPTGDQLGNTMWFTQYGEVKETSWDPEELPGITQVGTLPSDVNSVQNSYPALWNNRMTTNGTDSDGRNKTINWIPVPMPSAVGNQEELKSIIDKIKNGELESTDETAVVPIGTGTLTQTDDGSYEDPDAEQKAKAVIIPEALIDLINAVKEQTSGKTKIPTGTSVDVPTPPGSNNSGDGDTDPPVVPAGSISNGLCMVYNPVRSELVAFSRYLWSTNFIDLIPKLFQNPMDAIIGLHEIYVTPSVGGRANIVCGYLDSGVESNYVDKRYKEIDCGSVDIDEKFGTVFDYMYTDLEIFLPFIGYVKLDIGEVMRSKVSVKYTVDVLTGACNARIYVKRDSYEVHAYSFDGCCAASLPYSAGTNSMLFQIIANAGLGLVTGGLAGAAAGAAKGFLSGNVDVRKSGSFNPNAASMDDKVPFIIMQRNIDDTPTQFHEWQGYPLHQTAYLGGCKGYTIATNIHYTGPATSEEIAEIEDILSKGVIL